ncbi:MAG: biotin--[acetyl-CoA-carboxylase] ligase [Gemmatimonadaceae bacterium]|nr:biotin--[acetyl-CoA-carboxylase] ligase [Gemmatimonadaceae bacterium]
MRFHPHEWIDQVPSTNTLLLERIGSGAGAPPGTVLATADQTGGRGRGRRTWVSRPGSDLACSLVLEAAADPRRLGSLAMAAALGVADCLDEHGLTAQTKWPNDVIVGRRKIAGILPEQAPGRGRPGLVVVGVGLNLGMRREEAEAIDQPATSVLVETGSAPLPREVLPRLLQRLKPWLEAWGSGGFAALRGGWEERCAGLGERVTVVDDGERLSGVLAGFGEEGQLLLEEGGSVGEVWTGSLALGPSTR